MSGTCHIICAGPCETLRLAHETHVIPSEQGTRVIPSKQGTRVIPSEQGTRVILSEQGTHVIPSERSESKDLKRDSSTPGLRPSAQNDVKGALARGDVKGALARGDMKTSELSDLVIAVDGGFAYCLEVGIEPDLFVGDLDSLDPALADRIACERIELPRAKDDTDTLYACKEGLKREYTEFVLHAALGGDVGHELANIQTLSFLAQHGARGTLLGDKQTVHLVTPDASPCIFEAPVGTRVSVFAFGGNAAGVVERGLEWELDDSELSCSCPIGVSNRSTLEQFEIGVSNGALIVVIG